MLWSDPSTKLHSVASQPQSITGYMLGKCECNLASACCKLSLVFTHKNGCKSVIGYSLLKHYLSFTTKLKFLHEILEWKF